MDDVTMDDVFKKPETEPTDRDGARTVEAPVSGKALKRQVETRIISALRRCASLPEAPKEERKRKLAETSFESTDSEKLRSKQMKKATNLIKVIKAMEKNLTSLEKVIAANVNTKREIKELAATMRKNVNWLTGESISAWIMEQGQRTWETPEKEAPTTGSKGTQTPSEWGNQHEQTLKGVIEKGAHRTWEEVRKVINTKWPETAYTKTTALKGRNSPITRDSNVAWCMNELHQADGGIPNQIIERYGLSIILERYGQLN